MVVVVVVVATEKVPLSPVPRLVRGVTSRAVTLILAVAVSTVGVAQV